MKDRTEIWWVKLRIWPIEYTLTMEVYLEQRPIRPGMKYYECGGNDLAWLFWKLCDWIRGNDLIG